MIQGMMCAGNECEIAGYHNIKPRHTLFLYTSINLFPDITSPGYTLWMCNGICSGSFAIQLFLVATIRGEITGNMRWSMRTIESR